MGRENWSDKEKAAGMLSRIPLGRFAEVCLRVCCLAVCMRVIVFMVLLLISQIPLGRSVEVLARLCFPVWIQPSHDQNQFSQEVWLRLGRFFLSGQSGGPLPRADGTRSLGLPESAAGDSELQLG